MKTPNSWWFSAMTRVVILGVAIGGAIVLFSGNPATTLSLESVRKISTAMALDIAMAPGDFSGQFGTQVGGGQLGSSGQFGLGGGSFAGQLGAAGQVGFGGGNFAGQLGSSGQFGLGGGTFGGLGDEDLDGEDDDPDSENEEARPN